MVQRSDANYIFIDYPVCPEGLQVVVEFDVIFKKVLLTPLASSRFQFFPQRLITVCV